MAFAKHQQRAEKVVRNRRDLLRALNVWQRRLRLRDWRIEMDFDTLADDDCNATITFASDYQRATISLGAGWDTVPEKVLQETLVHELVHIVLRGMTNAQAAILYEGLMSRDVERQFNQRWDHEMERATENLAWILVDGMGLA